MNIRVVDWRPYSVRQILRALSQGLDANSQAFDDCRDVEDAIENKEDLCGIAFVSAAIISGKTPFSLKSPCYSSR
jgi:hypothetical protein